MPKLTPAQALEVSNFLRAQIKFAAESAKFHLAMGQLPSTFHEGIDKLKRRLDLAIGFERILPIAPPDILPAVLCMPMAKITLADQYNLYGFANNKRYICYIKLDQIYNTDFDEPLKNPYVILNVHRWFFKNNSAKQKHFFVSMEQALAIMKIVESRPNDFPWRHRMLVLGSVVYGTHFPCIDFGNSSAVIINAVKMHPDLAQNRDAISYDILLA